MKCRLCSSPWDLAHVGWRSDGTQSIVCRSCFYASDEALELRRTLGYPKVSAWSESMADGMKLRGDK